MRTFIALQTEVAKLLKQEVGTTGYWTPEEIKDAINSAYEFIADETLCFRWSEIIQIRAGIRIYKLPFNYVRGSLSRVEFDEKRIGMVTSSELDNVSRTWRSVEGSDIIAYLAPEDICESDEIAVYPKPDTDGNSYVTAQDSGVITSIGDTSYEEFDKDNGILIGSDGDAYSEKTGAVLEIEDPTNNLKVYHAIYPKRLYNDHDVPKHPVSDNPRDVLTHGALRNCFQKQGAGRDIQKASYYNKRFEETLTRIFKRTTAKRQQRIYSITDNISRRGYLNLGEHYPAYKVN